MKLVKETSERSDKDNWVKSALLSNNFALESLEGCSQNQHNQVTNLIERAFCSAMPTNLQEIYDLICNLESEKSLFQKIAFCNSFGLPLSYVIYGNLPYEYVKLLSIENKNEIRLIRDFNSYKEFSNWIQSIKGWYSGSPFNHEQELPFFDKELRRHGTAWPTNIDCFVSAADDKPTAILEFQNATKIPIQKHCNNNYFWGLTQKDDQRRWFSQEILRVQSNLPFIIITWSKIHKGFAIKKLDKVVFPKFDNQELKNLLRSFVQKRVNNTGQKTPRQLYDEICKNYTTEELYLENGIVKIKQNKPPLSYEDKTFPMLYYSFKHKEENNDKNKLIDCFGNALL